MSQAQSVIVAPDHLDNAAHDDTSKGQQLGTQSDAQNDQNLGCKMQQMGSHSCDSDIDVEGTMQIPSSSSSQDGQMMYSLCSVQQQGNLPASYARAQDFSAIESSITSDILSCLNADTVQPSLRQFDNALTDNTRTTVHSENDAVHALVMAGKNEDNTQPTLLNFTVPMRQNGQDLLDHHLLKKSQILDEPTGKKHQLSKTDKAVIESKQSAVHTVPSSEGKQQTSNRQNQGHAAAESENQKSNGKSQELNKQQMYGQNNGMSAQRIGNSMDVLDKNHNENSLQ